MARWLASSPFPAPGGKPCPAVKAGDGVNAAEYDPRKSDLRGRMVALAAEAAPQPPAGDFCLWGA